ncbi:MAG: hypothetical protein ACOVOV_15685 [Dolichospermum sp.]|jgi:hypothetical protein
MSEKKPPDDLHQSVKKPADRHYLSKVNQKSCKHDINTVIEPRVNVNDDMKAIRTGKATYRNENGNHTYIVNGRTYGVHTEKKSFGRTYPMRGDGFHTLNRGAYQALGVYNENGKTPQAQKALDRQREAFLRSKYGYDKTNKRYDPVMQAKVTRDQESAHKVWERVKGKEQSSMKQTSENAAMAGLDSRSKLEKAKEAAAVKPPTQSMQQTSRNAAMAGDYSKSKLEKAKEAAKNTQAPKPPTQSPKRTR